MTPLARIAIAAGRGALGAGLVLSLCLPVSPSTATASDLEEQVKAAMILNMAKFTEWPDSIFAGPDEPIVVGIVRNSGFAEVTRQIAARTQVHGRALSVRMAKTPADARGCHLVFFPSGSGSLRTPPWSTLRDLPILWIGEGEDFLDAGGAIAIGREENRLRFAVNLPAVGRARLTLSSKLLALATHVRKESP